MKVKGKFKTGNVIDGYSDLRRTKDGIMYFPGGSNTNNYIQIEQNDDGSLDIRTSTGGLVIKPKYSNVVTVSLAPLFPRKEEE